MARTKAEKYYDDWWKIKNYHHRIDFIENAIRETDFYFGEQYTKEQKETLESMGQAAIVINEIRRAFRQIINNLTARRPSGKLYATQGTSADVINAAMDLLSYIWYISDGTNENERAIKDMLIRRMGVLFVYEDPMSSYGQGDIKFSAEDIQDVYIDYNARKPQFRDARKIILSKLMTVDQARRDPELGKIKGLESAATGWDMEEYAMYGTSDRQDFKFGYLRGISDEDYIRPIETYEKVKINHLILRDLIYGRTIVLPEEKQDDEQIVNLIRNGYAKGVVIPLDRIKRTLTIGHKIFVSEEIMDISEYPFAFFYSEDSKNPYPKGELTHAKYEQEFINKFYSLAILNMQLMGMPKILAEMGQIPEVEKWRTKFAAPGSVNEFNPSSTGNPPIVIPAQQFQSGFFGLSQDLQNQIQRTIGAYNLGAGDPSQAPQTWKATAALLERQVQASSSVLRGLRAAYEQMYNVILEWIPSVYDTQRVIDIIDDEGHQVQNEINKPQYVAGKLEGILKDMTQLKAKIRVGLGTMLPSNRLMYQMMFSELAQVNPIFLKNMLQYMDDLPGKDKIIQELDTLPQMQQQLKQAGDAIKQLSARNQQLEQQLTQSLMSNKVKDFDVALKKKLVEVNPKP